MNNKEFKKMMDKKSALLLEAYFRKKETEEEKRQVKELLAEAAPLEEMIGNDLADRGKIFDASINWVSAGVCYSEIEQTENAIRMYEKIIKTAEEHPNVISKDVINNAKAYIAEKK